MGLIKTAVKTTKGFFGEQWKEFFYCDSMGTETLVTVGVNRAGKFKSSGNIISNGSVVAVNEGQCMLIIDQGKIVELCAEPGEFIFDNTTEPSLFDGGLLEGLETAAAEIFKRFTFGGIASRDQRVYYVNTKEIIGNKYGTANPVPFRVVDNNIGLDIDISIKCFGEYSYKIANPMVFFQNVCGNVTKSFGRDEIDSQLKSELMTALQPAFGKISEMGIRYSSLPNHTIEIANALNEILSNKWYEARGLVVHSFGVNSVKASKEDEDMIKELQRTSVFRNPNMAAAHLVTGQKTAMESAAANSAGAMVGFAGMNMVGQNTGGVNAQSLFAMGQQMPVNQSQINQPQNDVNTWTCSCGVKNSGKFCQECGSAQPVASGTWTCSCGANNTGKFCQECGNKKPEAVAKCNKCGWISNGTVPKFCPECGNKL